MSEKKREQWEQCQAKLQAYREKKKEMEQEAKKVHAAEREANWAKLKATVDAEVKASQLPSKDSSSAEPKSQERVATASTGGEEEYKRPIQKLSVKTASHQRKKAAIENPVTKKQAVKVARVMAVSEADEEVEEPEEEEEAEDTVDMEEEEEEDFSEKAEEEEASETEEASSGSSSEEEVLIKLKVPKKRKLSRKPSRKIAKSNTMPQRTLPLVLPSRQTYGANRVSAKRFLFV